MKTQLCCGWALGFFLLGCSLDHADAAICDYFGNGGGSPVGNGRLNISNNNNTVFFTLAPSTSWSANNFLVVYIDSVTGGWTSTAGSQSSGTPPAVAVSGLYGTSRATANFASGFGADYALVMAPADQGYNILYRLGTDGSLVFITSSVGFTQRGYGCSDQFDWTQIGLTAGSTNSIKFETTYINGYANRTLQGFETFASGSQAGVPGTVTYNNYDTFPAPVPEPANVALAVFGGAAGATALVSRIPRLRRERHCRGGRVLPPG